MTTLTQATPATDAIFPRLTEYALGLIRTYGGTGWGEAILPIQAEDGTWFARHLNFDALGDFTGMTLHPISEGDVKGIVWSVQTKAEYIARGELQAEVIWPEVGPFAVAA